MRFISLDQIQSGMVLIKNIYDASLKLLLRSGSTLNPRYIRRIQELGYQGVYITDDISSDIQIDDIVDTEQPHKYASGVEAHHEAKVFILTPIYPYSIIMNVWTVKVIQKELKFDLVIMNRAWLLKTSEI